MEGLSVNKKTEQEGNKENQKFELINRAKDNLSALRDTYGEKMKDVVSLISSGGETMQIKFSDTEDITDGLTDAWNKVISPNGNFSGTIFEELAGFEGEVEKYRNKFLQELNSMASSEKAMTLGEVVSLIDDTILRIENKLKTKE